MVEHLHRVSTEHIWFRLLQVKASAISQLQLTLQSYALKQTVLRGIMQCYRLVRKKQVFSLDRNCR